MVVEYKNVSFDVDDSGTLTSIRSDTMYKNVTIPSKLKGGIEIHKIGSRAFHGSFGKVKISNGITIDAGAFTMAQVEEVFWNDYSVIPFRCFLDCAIKKIHNIHNVSKVCKDAFCRSCLRSISWPSWCFHIPDDCFWNCSIKKISNISHVSGIGSRAFAGTDIGKFVVPTGVARVGDEAFRDCMHLKYASLSNSVTCVGDNLFFGSAVKKVQWSLGCTFIPHHCFDGCEKLVSVGNISNVTYIGQGAFAACFSLSRIEIPKSINKIEGLAFDHSGIKEIEWPDKCDTIPYRCFSYSQIQKITNTDNISEVRDEAFYAAACLEQIDLSISPISYLGKSAFECVPRESVALPYYMC